MRKEAVLILLLIIAVVALLSFSNRFNQTSGDDARKFFREDLARNYPDADAREVLTSVQVGEGASAYYLLKARVSYNLSTPCPTRTEVEYYYPPQSFVRRPPQKLVSNCQVCGGSNGTCVLSYIEEAIIASHTETGTESVARLLNYDSGAKPTARLLPTWNDASDVWQVDWTSDGSSGLSVYLAQSTGRVLAVQQLARASS